jgi:hypothetical protein
MIGELLLHKISADALADAYAESAAPAAGTGVRASGTGVRASGTGYAPVDDASGASNSADAVSSDAGGAAASKGAVLVSSWWGCRSRPDLEGSVYDFFMARCAAAGYLGLVT